MGWTLSCREQVAQYQLNRLKLRSPTVRLTMNLYHHPSGISNLRRNEINTARHMVDPSTQFAKHIDTIIDDIDRYRYDHTVHGWVHVSVHIHWPVHP